MSESAVPWRTDAELAADDHAHQERSYAEQLDMDVARKARDLKVAELARARLAAEKKGDLPPFDAGTLDEILARGAPPTPRVEDLIPAEAGTLIVAAKKTGKTTLQLNLTRSLIEGTDFLGKFGVRKIDGNVGFLNFEVSGHTLASWADEHRVARDRLFLVNLRGRINPFRDPDELDRLARLLKLHDVETLIVDPFGRAYTGQSQNDAGEVGAWLSELDQFARGTAGCVDLILAAHAGWNGERTRGSTALDDWADSIVTLTRDRDNDQQRFLKAEGRDVLIDEDQLTFEPPTRTLRLAGTGSRKTTAKIVQVERLMPVVLELLRESESPTMSGNKLDEGIKKLIDSGDLDAKHSKGDGARAANLLEKRGVVASKDGPRGARLFTALTSPTSPNLPEGTEATSPPPLIGGSPREVTPTTSPGHTVQET